MSKCAWVDGLCVDKTESSTGPSSSEFSCDVRWGDGKPAWSKCTKEEPYISKCSWVATDEFPDGQCLSKDDAQSQSTETAPPSTTGYKMEWTSKCGPDGTTPKCAPYSSWGDMLPNSLKQNDEYIRKNFTRQEAMQRCVDTIDCMAIASEGESGKWRLVAKSSHDFEDRCTGFKQPDNNCWPNMYVMDKVETIETTCKSTANDASECPTETCKIDADLPWGAEGKCTLKSVMDDVNAQTENTCDATVLKNSEVDKYGLGYAGKYRGFFKRDGCEEANTMYCRWVGGSGNGGDPTVRTKKENSFWSCLYKDKNGTFKNDEFTEKAFSAERTNSVGVSGQYTVAKDDWDGELEGYIATFKTDDKKILLNKPDGSFDSIWDINALSDQNRTVSTGIYELKMQDDFTIKTLPNADNAEEHAGKSFELRKTSKQVEAQPADPSLEYVLDKHKVFLQSRQTGHIGCRAAAGAIGAIGEKCFRLESVNLPGGTWESGQAYQLGGKCLRMKEGFRCAGNFETCQSNTWKLEEVEQDYDIVMSGSSSEIQCMHPTQGQGWDGRTVKMCTIDDYKNGGWCKSYIKTFDNSEKLGNNICAAANRGSEEATYVNKKVSSEGCATELGGSGWTAMFNSPYENGTCCIRGVKSGTDDADFATGAFDELPACDLLCQMIGPTEGSDSTIDGVRYSRASGYITGGQHLDPEKHSYNSLDEAVAACNSLPNCGAIASTGGKLRTYELYNGGTASYFDDGLRGHLKKDGFRTQRRGYFGACEGTPTATFSSLQEAIDACAKDSTCVGVAHKEAESEFKLHNCFFTEADNVFTKLD